MTNGVQQGIDIVAKTFIDLEILSLPKLLHIQQQSMSLEIVGPTLFPYQ